MLLSALLYGLAYLMGWIIISGFIAYLCIGVVIAILFSDSFLDFNDIEDSEEKPFQKLLAMIIFAWGLFFLARYSTHASNLLSAIVGRFFYTLTSIA